MHLLCRKYNEIDQNEKKKTTLISDNSKQDTRLIYKIPSLYYIPVVNKQNLKLKLQ